MVGIGLLVTWAFGLAGYHAPYQFAMATVGTTGAMIVTGCVIEAIERGGEQLVNPRQQPPAGQGGRA